MLRNRVISGSSTMLEALKKMDETNSKLLILINGNKFAGLISAGDIQRAIIQNNPLTVKVKDIIRKNIRIARPDDSAETVKKMMFDYRMELCPLVNLNNEIESVYFWEDVFQENKVQPVSTFNLPVVIMAGGLGTRLKPLTNVLPKPLIPIGNKTMLEEIFERFSFHGCDHFFVSVNYKADLIKYYINNQNLPYRIEFIKEDKPNGTAGSLSLLSKKINTTFFVNNCDILIDQDYSEILEYHRSNNNELTIVAALKSFSIPYGTIETGKNGMLKNLLEKPELTFKINSGMYILEPHIINEIPNDRKMHITQLIDQINKQGRRIGVFPVSTRSWTDVGTWSEIYQYYKNVR